MPTIVGSYDVSGVNAVDKKSYEGVAIISKKGEAYQVTYEDSDGKFLGVGFPMGNVFGIAFSTENKPTLSLMEPDGAIGWIRSNGYPTAAVWYPSVAAIGFPFQYMALIRGAWELVVRVGA